MSAKHAETCWPRIQCHFGSSVTACFAGSTSRQFDCLPVRTRVHLCLRRRRIRLSAYPLSFPLHGLRTSRYRGECASTLHQGRSESHRHRNQVLRFFKHLLCKPGANPPTALRMTRSPSSRGNEMTAAILRGEIAMLLEK